MADRALDATDKKMGGLFPCNVQTIGRIAGRLLLMEAGLMTITAAVALGFQEFYAAFGFFTAAGMTAGVGGLANRGFSDAPAPR